MKIDEFVKSHSLIFVIPAKAGIQGNHPAAAGVTVLDTFYETIIID